jgi:hypothetical protein
VSCQKFQGFPFSSSAHGPDSTYLTYCIAYSIHYIQSLMAYDFGIWNKFLLFRRNSQTDRPDIIVNSAF